MASLGYAQLLAEVMDYGFEHAGFAPTLALLVDRVPRWQIRRPQPLRGPCADDPAQAIADFTQAMLALGASSVMRATEGATSAHASSPTSLG
jgi:hypothetical protein